MASSLKQRLDRSVTEELIFDYLKALNCPRSLAVWLLYSSGEHEQLAQLTVTVDHYSDPFTFRDAYTATHLLSKFKGLNIKPKDREKRALEKFNKFELGCAAANIRISLRDWTDMDEFLIQRVRCEIDLILGVCPSLQDVEVRSSWGPGATIAVKRRDASSFKKFRDERGITSKALHSILDEAQGPVDVAFGKVPLAQDGDKVIVVDKNSWIDRVIIIQPGLNLRYQKGAAWYIRRALARHGLDLGNATLRKQGCLASDENQELARKGSIDGSYCTIDFSSASDSICKLLPKLLLKPRWFALLESLRTDGSSDGRRWNKFSAMGNGFTFELETLIFFAMARVCLGLCDDPSGRVSVFGDDVVLPTQAVPLFLHLSELFGFTPNHEKTFTVGNFRESCGSHWYAGVNCKPAYLKDRISNVEEAYKVHNKIVSLASRYGFDYYRDRRFKRICHNLVHAVPRDVRFYTSLGTGDCGFASSFDEARPPLARGRNFDVAPQTPRDGESSRPNRSRAPSHFEGYLQRCKVDLPLSFSTEEGALLMVRLTEHSDQSQRNLVGYSGRTRAVIATVLVHEWYHLGPWERI